VLLAPASDASGTYFQIPSANATLQPGLKYVQAVITAPPPGLRPIASPTVPLALLLNITGVAPANGPFDGATQVVISGTALGVAPANLTDPPGPMCPSVLFGGYAIPTADLDLTQLPTKITATLNPAPNASAPQPPSGATPIPVRVRVNSLENQSWRLNAVTNHYEFIPGLLFTPQ
jgi:hypothetical protein